MPATSPSPRLSSLWDDWGDLVQIGIFGSSTVLIILGAIFIAPEILIGLALVVVGYGLVSGILDL